jgi:hypothetical protein
MPPTGRELELRFQPMVECATIWFAFTLPDVVGAYGDFLVELFREGDEHTRFFDFQLSALFRPGCQDFTAGSTLERSGPIVPSHFAQEPFEFPFVVLQKDANRREVFLSFLHSCRNCSRLPYELVASFAFKLSRQVHADHGAAEPK